MVAAEEEEEEKKVEEEGGGAEEEEEEEEAPVNKKRTPVHACLRTAEQGNKCQRLTEPNQPTMEAPSGVNV